MPIKLNYKDSNFTCETIVWDRDTFFVDREGYWIRVVANLAQKIAELSTTNWDKFNAVRNEVIKTFFINPETGEIDSISPLFVIPLSSFNYLILNSLKAILADKSVSDIKDSLNKIFITENLEFQKYLESSILVERLDILKKFTSVKQVFVTNDSEFNNKIFLSKISGDVKVESFTDINKENLFHLLKSKAVFITGNSYLFNIYKKHNYDNVLFVDDIELLKLKTCEAQCSTVFVNIDGASRGNPGLASIGIVFRDREDNILQEISESLGVKTNNFAEYTALIRALEIASASGYKDVNIFSDSELVVKQVNKIYKVKDENIKILCEKVNLLIPKFQNFSLKHIPREKNVLADKLANKALDG